MTMSDFPPGLVLIIGAFLLPIIGQRLRPMLTLGLPLLTLYLVWSLPNGTLSTFPLLDYNLAFVQSDSISRLFATVFFYNDIWWKLVCTQAKASVGIGFSICLCGQRHWRRLCWRPNKPVYFLGNNGCCVNSRCSFGGWQTFLSNLNAIFLRPRVRWDTIIDRHIVTYCRHRLDCIYRNGT